MRLSTLCFLVANKSGRERKKRCRPVARWGQEREQNAVSKLGVLLLMSCSPGPSFHCLIKPGPSRHFSIKLGPSLHFSIKSRPSFLIPVGHFISPLNPDRQFTSLWNPVRHFISLLTPVGHFISPSTRLQPHLRFRRGHEAQVARNRWATTENRGRKQTATCDRESTATENHGADCNRELQKQEKAENSG